MCESRRFGWWGLYALIPSMIGLIVLDDVVPITEAGHLVVLAAIVFVICGLAVAWVDRNARFIETDGLDGLSAYCILFDTAVSPSDEPIMQEARREREGMSAVESDITADPSAPASDKPRMNLTKLNPVPEGAG